ncbi:MAG: lactate utilization protein [Spirochaetes bacterium]|nr:lactate utilization protein [Spirochaetota bacterium]
MATNIESRNSKLGPVVVKALKSRFFDAWYFDKAEEAIEAIVSAIPKDHLVSWGGSTTVAGLGIQARLEKDGYKLLDRDKATSPEERVKFMREALLCDTYLAGTNAISEDGELVNVDGNGNRVAAMTYGPKQVIVVAGINKVVKTLEDATTRARTFAAPINVQKFPNFKTPCNEAGKCENCKSPDSICSFIVTTRLCRPAGRIKVFLIGDVLGF